MSYIEKINEVYDEFYDTFRNLEMLVRTTDRLRESDRHLLLITLGKLSDVVELLSELPTIDGSGRYIEEDFVVGRIRDATELLREVRDEITQGTPDGLAEEELDVDVHGHVMYIREELLDMLKRVLERARQEGASGGRYGGDK
jgi:hypothetical protein